MNYNLKEELYSVIKASITDEKESRVVSDWDQLYLELKEQAILPLVANHLSKDTPSKIRQEITLYAQQSLMQWYSLIDFQNEIVDLFKENGISFAIIKGYVATIHYPEPYFRSMGDIDILVAPEDFDKSVVLLRENEFDSHGDDKRHVEFGKNGFEVELHRFFALDQEDIINEYLLQSIQERCYLEVEGYSFPAFPDVQNGLIFLEHIKQHLIGGLGFRQILDWMLYVNDVLDDKFWKESFCEKARQYGLEKLAITVTYACQKYLGLSDRITWCKDADDKLAEELMDFVFLNGNFGRKLLEQNSGQYVFESISKGGVFKRLQTRGEHNWALLREHPKWRPFAWLYQICRYIKRGFSRKNPIKSLMTDYRESKKQKTLSEQLFTGRENVN